jgi:hypothetical protein
MKTQKVKLAEISLHYGLSFRRLTSKGRVLLIRYREKRSMMGVLNARVPLRLI